MKNWMVAAFLVFSLMGMALFTWISAQPFYGEPGGPGWHPISGLRIDVTLTVVALILCTISATISAWLLVTRQQYSSYE